jgi:hypothetical protein
MICTAVSIPTFLTYYEDDKSNFRKDLNDLNYENGLVVVTDAVSSFLAEYLDHLNNTKNLNDIRKVYEMLHSGMNMTLDFLNECKYTDYYTFIEYISLVEYSVDEKGRILAELINIDDKFSIDDSDVANIRETSNSLFTKFISVEENSEKFYKNKNLYVFIVSYAVWMAGQPLSIFDMDD